ncbi:MAG: helix-turn-helix domain-containing protein [Actinomycetota bacterium]|nr:helix-turn-helix domain-containing protein [Actinomycetota bacterium]
MGKCSRGGPPGGPSAPTASRAEGAEIVRDARRAAALTQAELARRAGTAQSALAVYESGTRTPSLSTLARLPGACDYELALVARPRVHRGAASLHELATAVEEDLKAPSRRGGPGLARE